VRSIVSDRGLTSIFGHNPRRKNRSRNRPSAAFARERVRPKWMQSQQRDEPLLRSPSPSTTLSASHITTIRYCQV